MPRKLADPHPCACSPTCTSLTRRTFAQGHDMRHGPHADGKAAGAKARETALAGKRPAISIPAKCTDPDRWLAGFAAGLRPPTSSPAREGANAD